MQYNVLKYTFTHINYVLSFLLVFAHRQGDRRRRGREAQPNEAEGMGAMTRRRRRRGDEEEDDDEAGGKKEDENEDNTDGKRGREKMDAETRRRAMRGGKIVEDEKASFDYSSSPTSSSCLFSP